MEQKNAAIVADVRNAHAPPPAKPDQPRGFIAEWTVTIILLLFGTTTLVQAFVIPTGSMEDTLLIGDHLLVDKLAYAPAGRISKYMLPYEPVKRGDIIVFRYPVDIKSTFVKRCMGVPGDRIKLVNKEVYLNGKKLAEPYVYHKTEYIDSYRDNFPSEPNGGVLEPGLDMLE
ncbi:MAG TPA: signal peptidase I, partial [Bryobacteraceae bacterium]|nr:signal peptidase I [Bryobacteraceae bacterium]